MQPYMQKLRNWSLPAVLASAVFLSSCGEKDPLEKMRSHAPADTAFYLESRLDSEFSYKDPRLLTQVEIALAQLKDSEAIDETSYEQLRQAMVQYIEVFDVGSDAFTEKYGLAKDMASAFYLDGLYPVIQFALVDEGEKLSAVIAEKATEMDVTLASETIAEQNVTILTLPELEGATFTLQLAFVVKDNIASLALITDQLTAERKAEVLGLVAEDSSVASTKQVASLYDDYELNQVAGYLNLVAFSDVVANPSQSTLAQDLENGLADEGLSLAELSSDVSEQCIAESSKLFQSVPRLVMGATAVESSDEQYTMDFRYVLELKNTKLLNSLMSLNGHVPSFVANAAEQADTILAMGIGLDTKALTEALDTSSSFDFAEHFNCENFAEMVNPLADPTIRQALAMPTVDTLKGIGLALFDFDFDQSTFDINLDALVTLAVDDPMSLVSTAKLFLPLPSLYDLEQDTTVDLELPIPLPLDIKASVQGNHIGVFVGEKAEKAFAEEASNELNSDGILSAYIDVQKIAELATQLDSFSGLSDSNSCADVYLLEYNLAGSGDFQYQDTFTEHGFQIDYQTSMELNNESMVGDFDPLGAYRISSQDEGCDWYVFGEEEISDNIGYYDYFDEPSDQCGLSRYTYNWSFDGMRLEFVETTALTRADCNADWVVDTSYTDEDFASYSCIVTKYDDASFECVMFNGDGSKDLYRYSKK